MSSIGKAPLRTDNDIAASTIARRVYAAAQVLQTQEETNIGHVVGYVRKLTMAGRIRNSTFVECCAYDET
eukprot:5740161-Amphidinium_carterae.1